MPPAPTRLRGQRADLCQHGSGELGLTQCEPWHQLLLIATSGRGCNTVGGYSVASSDAGNDRGRRLCAACRSGRRESSQYDRLVVLRPAVERDALGAVNDLVDAVRTPGEADHLVDNRRCRLARRLRRRRLGSNRSGNHRFRRRGNRWRCVRDCCGRSGRRHRDDGRRSGRFNGLVQDNGNGSHWRWRCNDRLWFLRGHERRARHGFNRRRRGNGRWNNQLGRWLGRQHQSRFGGSDRPCNGCLRSRNARDLGLRLGLEHAAQGRLGRPAQAQCTDRENRQDPGP